jgi:branched-chain amino acid transport system substrate-binding protein
MRHYKWWLIGLMIVGAVLTGCQGLRPQKTVKVAVSLPLDRGIAQNMLHAAELALDERGGQVGNVVVEIVEFNTARPDEMISMTGEEEAAEAVAADQDFVGYIGPLASSQAQVSLPILNEAGVAQLSASTTWPGLTKPGFVPGEPGIYYPTGRRHFFRTVPADDVQGIVAAQWARDLGFETVYIVTDNTAYGNGLSGIFQANAENIGLEVLGSSKFEGEAADAAHIQEIVDQLAAAEPDVVYLAAGFGTGGTVFFSPLADAELGIPVIVPDGMANDEFIAEVGSAAAEGTYATNVMAPPNELETASAFLTAYRETYDEEPHPYSVAVYEAMGVLLEAIEKADSPTREGVLTALQNLGTYEGALGTWSFDDRGDTSVEIISGLQVVDGEWEFFRLLQ